MNRPSGLYSVYEEIWMGILSNKLHYMPKTLQELQKIHIVSFTEFWLKSFYGVLPELLHFNRDCIIHEHTLKAIKKKRFVSETFGKKAKCCAIFIFFIF